MTCVNAYPYLTETLVLVAIAAIAVYLQPRHRSFLLIAGLTAIPYVALSYYHIPWFWNPTCVCYCVTCPEDALWVFAAGATACCLSVIPFSERLQAHACSRRVLARYLVLSAVSGLVFLAALRVFPDRTDIMYPTLATMLVMSVVCAALRRDLLPLALAGSISYTLYHGVDVFAFTHVWPKTTAYWNPPAQVPLTILRIPAFELLWALAFGFLWPLMIGYCCQIAWRRESDSACEAVISEPRNPS
jgi:hypothetical protein